MEVASSEMMSCSSAASGRSMLAKLEATSVTTSWASERPSMRVCSCAMLVVATPVMPIAPAVMLKGSMMNLSVYIGFALLMSL